MKKIGFIDYYISEWHANNYPRWIKEASERLLEEFSVAYVYAELDVSPVDGVTTDEWCEKYGAERCSSIAELCERSDYICILAPSNPEKHLEYAREAFKHGKRTYVDKTFADSCREAEEIFALGEKYGTPFFTTSALRYATELDEIADARSVIVTGPGSNFAEYVIHLCEIAVRILKKSPVRIKAEPQGRSQCIVRVALDDSREATLVFAPFAPYTVVCEMEEGAAYKAFQSEFFPRLIEDILRFYLTGEVSFDPAETLWVMKMREGAIKAAANPGEWISLA